VLLAPVLGRLAGGQQQQRAIAGWLLRAGLLEGLGRQADADLVLIALQAQGLEEGLGWGISVHWGCAGEAAAGHPHGDVAEAQQ